MIPLKTYDDNQIHKFDPNILIFMTFKRHDSVLCVGLDRFCSKNPYKLLKNALKSCSKVAQILKSCSLNYIKVAPHIFSIKVTISMFLKKAANVRFCITLFIVPLMVGAFLFCLLVLLHDIIIIKLYALNFT